MKQGYIGLLPRILRFLAGTRKIVRYHDVTPGSQITWNTAFLAVTSAHRRGGNEEVAYLLEVLDAVARGDEKALSPEMRDARLALYRDCNDAFRDLLLGKFGKLPLGFPPDWVYRSAFGDGWEKALAARTEKSPLESLPDVDFEAERRALADLVHREVSEEEFLMYLNHPADALKTMELKLKFGDANRLPLDVWFEGLKEGDELNFMDSAGKPHHLALMHIQPEDDNGVRVVQYQLDSEIFSEDVRVGKGRAAPARDVAEADPENKYHVGAPSNGDLWVVYATPGAIVKKGEELFNVSIMKQEKAVLAPMDAMVKRVLKTADYKTRKKMVPVLKGELIIELESIPKRCPNEACAKPISSEGFAFCPHCGAKC